MKDIVSEIRAQLGLTQVELGQRIGCTHRMVSAMETGARNPGPGLVAALWDVCPEELRPALAGAVLEAGGVPVEYRERYILTEKGLAALEEMSDE